MKDKRIYGMFGPKIKAIGLQKEMSAYEWAKGHSGVLPADDVVKKDEKW